VSNLRISANPTYLPIAIVLGDLAAFNEYGAQVELIASVFYYKGFPTKVKSEDRDGSRVIRAVDSRPQGALWLFRCCCPGFAGTAQDRKYKVRDGDTTNGH
jgi:hypothetical protein